MLFKLNFRQFDKLPRLAWCAKIQRRSEVVEVLHGPWVEVGSESFCEGAWNGDFTVGQFESGILMGSGGKTTNHGMLFASPNHSLERLYLLKDKDTIIVSNSIAFVFALAGDGADPKYLLYGAALVSIIHGLRKYARSIPTKNGNQLYMYCHCNLHVNAELKVVEKPKRPVRDFTDFNDYRAFLDENVTAIHANANNTKRKIKYSPIASISSGYDSPTAAVFAKHVGCSEALTFSHARPDAGTGDLSDSGAPIAAVLDMETKTHDRLDYLNQKGFPEVEFLGGPPIFAAWEDSLERRLFFTGFNGDNLWDRNCKFVSPYFRRKDASGAGLGEFRLRVGFIHLPLTFIGGTSHPSIHGISTSKEMEPWALGNEYDRPIPRRIVEEAGVDRRLFGRTKKATHVNAAKEGGVKAVMKEDSLIDFDRFYKQHWNFGMEVKTRVYGLIKYLYRKNKAWNKRVNRRFERTTGFRLKLPSLLPQNARIIDAAPNISQYSLRFHWALKKLIPRYKID